MSALIKSNAPNKSNATAVNRFSLRIIITFLILMLIFAISIYFFLFQPMRKELTDSMIKSFSQQAEMRYQVFDHTVELSIQTVEDLAGRVGMREIINYYDGKVDLEELASFVKPRYRDSLASADYLVHAERIIDGETIGLLSADGFDYEQVTANKTILTDEWNESFYLDNGDVYYMIVSPISVEVKVLGYDHVIFRYNEPLAMFKSEYVSSEIIDATAYAELTNYAEIVAFNDNSEIMIIDHVYYHVTDLTDTYYFVTSQDEESLLHAVENLMYRAVIVIPSLLLAQILVIFFVVIFYVGREFAVYENHNRKLSRELDKAQLDSLTGVGARALCEEELGFLFAEYIKNGISPAILMFDLDDLKKINDSYGHLAGDEAIKAAVDAVVASIRADDHVYRWGGDEFVGIIYGLLPQNVSNFVEKIQQAFANLEVIFENNVIRPRISIGVTYFYEQDSDYFNAISRADYAMYKSKINGTNQSTVV